MNAFPVSVTTSSNVIVNVPVVVDSTSTVGSTSSTRPSSVAVTRATPNVLTVSSPLNSNAITAPSIVASASKSSLSVNTTLLNYHDRK